MSFFELIFIAIGLSMDAFAVSACYGLCMQKVASKKSIIIGLYFGAFQFLMPVLGYVLAKSFADKITSYDHWIVFVLLAFIGGKMIFDSFKDKEGESCKEKSLGFKTMLTLAVATSIDALAVGVSFAFLRVQILPASLLIGFTTFVISILGVKIGNIFGSKFESKAEFVGGAILIIIGVKILLEHLGVFGGAAA